MQTVYARTLKRAAELLGGDERLARYLAVAPSRLALWLAGAEAPPTEVFLNAVDIVTDAALVKLTMRSPAQASVQPGDDPKAGKK